MKALDAAITQQAQIIAYIDDYKLLMIATLAVIPLLIVFKKNIERQCGSHARNGMIVSPVDHVRIGATADMLGLPQRLRILEPVRRLDRILSFPSKSELRSSLA
jgi:hypothetical protein